MSSSFKLKLTHTSQSADNLLLSDTLPDHSDFVSDGSIFNPVYVPVGEAVEMTFTSEVAKSYKEGVIRNLIINGDLTYQFLFGNKVLERSNGFAVVTSASYSVQNTDFYLFINNDEDASVTLTLPEGTGHLGQLRIFDMKGDSETHNIVINPSGSDTVEGDATYTISDNAHFMELYYANGNWAEKDIINRKKNAATYEVVSVSDPGIYRASAGQLIEVDSTAGDIDVLIYSNSKEGDNVVVKRSDNSVNSVRIFSVDENLEDNTNNAYTLDSQHDTVSFVRGTAQWLLYHSRLANTGGLATLDQPSDVVQIIGGGGGGGGGVATLLVNPDFATGDFTGWTVYDNPGGTQGPTVHTFSPQTGLYNDAQKFGEGNYYVSGGRGHDGGSNFSYIEQTLDVGSSQEFMYSAALGGQTSQREDAALTVTFKDSNGNPVATETNKTIILSFLSYAQYNGSYTKTNLTGAINYNSGFVFDSSATDKPIWLMSIYGQQFIIIYNQSFGSTRWDAVQMMTFTFDQLVDGFQFGTDGNDWTSEIIQTDSGDYIDGYYYPNDTNDIAAMYDTFALRGTHYDRWIGSYVTQQTFKEAARTQIPANASTADVRITFEKTDGSTSLDIDGTISNLRFLWFDNPFAGWSQADSSINGTYFGDSMVMFIGGSITGTAVTNTYTAADSYYVEFIYMTANGTNDGAASGDVFARIGTVDHSFVPSTDKEGIVGQGAQGWAYNMGDGMIYHNATGNPITDGQVESDSTTLCLAVDGPTGNVWVGRVFNGVRTWLNSGDPENGTNPSWTMTDTTSWRIAFSDEDFSNSTTVDITPGHMNMVLPPAGFKLL